jgi:hypothetical protein
LGSILAARSGDAELGLVRLGLGFLIGAGSSAPCYRIFLAGDGLIDFVCASRSILAKLSHRLRQLQPNHPEIVGGFGASKWDPGDDHDTIALLGCALINPEFSNI